MPPTRCRRITARWGSTPALFATHIAYDIGAATVTRALAAAYGAPAVLGALVAAADRSQSRRRRSHPGDETVGRQHHSRQPRRRRAEVARRIAEFHAPYHAAIAARDRSGIGRGRRDRSPCTASRRSGKACRGHGRWACCRTARAPGRPLMARAGARPVSPSATTSPIPARWKATRSIATAPCAACRMC